MSLEVELTPPPPATKPVLPWPGLLTILVAHGSAGWALGHEWLWAFFGLLFFISHWLRWQPLQGKMTVALGVAALGLLPLAAVGLDDFPRQPGFVGTFFLNNSATYTFALLSGLALAVINLQPLRADRERSMALISTVLMMTACNIQSAHPRGVIMPNIVPVFGLFLLLWLGQISRRTYRPAPRTMPPGLLRRRRVWSVILVIATAAMSIAGAFALRYANDNVGRELWNWIRLRNSGSFGERTQIGRVRRAILGKGVVLWYERPERGGPLYLVGRRYGAYSIGGHWSAGPRAIRELKPFPARREGPWAKRLHEFQSQDDADFKVFDLGRREAELGPRSEPLYRHSVVLTRQPNGTLFAPARSRALSVPWLNLHVSDNAELVIKGAKYGHEYRLLLGSTTLGRGAPAELSPKLRGQLTALPPTLLPFLLAKSQSILGAERNHLAQAKALESWFQRSYTYSLEFSRDAKIKDPAIDFLSHKKPAWCEFFATSMCLLMRARGIPARYVAGFLATERDPSTETYTVRGADAHAWVELYIDGQGWTRFDPTAGGGRSQNAAHQKPGALQRLLDHLQKLWTELALKRMRLSIKDFLRWLGMQLVSLILWLFSEPLRALISLALVLLLAAPRLRAWWRGRRSAKDDSLSFTGGSFGELDQLFGARLARFDRALETRGIERAPHLTPNETALALEQQAQAEARPTLASFAGAMSHYGRLRYRGRPPSSEELADLDGVLATLEELKEA